MQNTNKFGTFKGVFVPSILTILGVILFLRLGWVVGQAGLASTILIISLSSLITLITALSISSAATNTEVGPGGSYFLISRCFGLELGAAIGIPLYLAQTLGITFYATGFAESLKLFFPEVPVTYVAFGTLFFLTMLTLKSSSLVLKTQVFIFIIIIAALVSFSLGQPLNSELQEGKNIVIEKFGFWAIFAVFFPAVTGIEAGISMSGDLKNPRRSLPIGTLSAVGVGFLAYVLFAIKFHTVAPAETLVSNALLMTEVAVFGLIIYIGLWGATISSTMGALLGAPRTMQALAMDNILPRFLGKGSKEGNEPKIATLVSFGIAATGLLMGDLNAIAAILSMFFLTSYGVLNLVSGFEGLLANPSWRPTFKVPWVVSMLGALLCFGAMFMINPGASFIAIAFVIAIYLITGKRQLRSKNSDIRGGLVKHFARELIYKFESANVDERNWKPHFLVFSGAPKSRLYLIDIAYAISRKRGFMTIASVLTTDNIDEDQSSKLEDSSRTFLEKQGISALVKITTDETFTAGANALIKNYGIGRITPNTIILGHSGEGGMQYINVLNNVLAANKNLLIFKAEDGFDESKAFSGESIDVWWQREGDNTRLMLTLAYMLQTSEKWQGAKLTFKSIVDNEDQRQGVEAHMQEFLKESRISADVEIVFGTSDSNEHIVKSSENADLVFLGIPENEKGEISEADYNAMVKGMTGLPNTVLVLKGENTEFKDIFN